jgi:hypothetical protein
MLCIAALRHAFETSENIRIRYHPHGEISFLVGSADYVGDLGEDIGIGER